MKTQDRTFVVSGGASGLGLATVQLLVKEGAYVAILDLTVPDNVLAELGSQVKFFKTDITNDDEVEKAVEGTISWCAETKAALGGAVNCAGVGTAAKVINAHGEPHSLGLWKFAIDVNLTGSFNLSRLVCQHLAEVEPEGPDKERGIIILVASAAAFEGQPGQTAYSATKGALVSMALPMARDLAPHGIRVNVIAPGGFTSAMTARIPPKARASLDRELIFPRRFGEPPEFAQTVKFLIDCPYMNGETVRLSGAGRLPGKL